MAVGDHGNISERLKQMLPPSWFPDPAANKFHFLQGFASIGSWLYSLIVFAKLQTRISTASGFFLDLMSFDFFGRNFPRAPLETDAAFSAGIKKELLRVRGTRAGLIQALLDLTGRAPIVFYPANAPDTGAYGYAMGYGVAGRYGSLLMPFQALINAYRPASSGIPNIPGYGAITSVAGSVLAGYGITGEYADISQIVGAVTDAQIYARIASVSPEGVIPWTNLSGATAFGTALDRLRAGFNVDLGFASVLAVESDDLGAAASLETLNINLGVGA